MSMTTCAAEGILLCTKSKMVYVVQHIVQNFGEVKLWQIGRFWILARKTLANTPIWNIGDGKTLANSRNPISFLQIP